MPFPGVHGVLYAFFDRAGRLDRGAMRAQTEWTLAAGVDGITVLGLATEVQKLDPEEQRDVIAWAAEDVAGRVPLSVTVTGNSVAAQRRMVQVARDHGAAWLILQPPAAGAFGAQTYVDFFAEVAEGFDTPFSIQNAPQYLGRALLAEDVARLTARNPNFRLIKAETSAVDLAALVARCGDGLTVLNGRGGLEMTDCLRAGASGFVLAPDLIDLSKRVHDHWQAGETEAADRLYAEMLPAIVFMMQSVEHLICYGKRLFARRAGLTVHDRQPALGPTDFGLRCAEGWAAHAEAIAAGKGGGREPAT
jgi:4-hydroxy-tetrahydrodipicolinate synthase